MTEASSGGTTPGGTPSETEEPDFDWSWAEEDDSSWVPPSIDTTRPSVARMYDYSLGGKDNFAVDREAAHRAWEVMPDGPDLARYNRTFLTTAVRLMAQAGVRQFLDLGTGIPTSPSVHEVAREVIPDARVVYVDNDPIVLAHSRALLDGDPHAASLMFDLREPANVLRDRTLRSMIDLEQPVGLLMIAALHFVDLSIGVQVVRHYLERIAGGSYLAFSVATLDGVEPSVTRRLEEIYRNSSAPMTFRTLAQVEELIDGIELLEPGITDVSRWRNDGDLLTMRMHAGVGLRH
jgi:hypothetical protein